MMAARLPSNDDRVNKIAKEGLRILMKKKWDPVTNAVYDQKLVGSFISNEYECLIIIHYSLH